MKQRVFFYYYYVNFVHPGKKMAQHSSVVNGTNKSIVYLFFCSFLSSFRWRLFKYPTYLHYLYSDYSRHLCCFYVSVVVPPRLHQECPNCIYSTGIDSSHRIAHIQDFHPFLILFSTVQFLLSSVTYCPTRGLKSQPLYYQIHKQTLFLPTRPFFRRTS